MHKKCDGKNKQVISIAASNFIQKLNYIILYDIVILVLLVSS